MFYSDFFLCVKSSWGISSSCCFSLHWDLTLHSYGARVYSNGILKKWEQYVSSKTCLKPFSDAQRWLGQCLCHRSPPHTWMRDGLLWMDAMTCCVAGSWRVACGSLFPSPTWAGKGGELRPEVSFLGSLDCIWKCIHKFQSSWVMTFFPPSSYLTHLTLLLLPS